MSSFISCKSLKARRAVWNFFRITFVSFSRHPVSSAGNMRDPPCGVHTKDATKLLRAQILGPDGVKEPDAGDVFGREFVEGRGRERG